MNQAQYDQIKLAAYNNELEKIALSEGLIRKVLLNAQRKYSNIDDIVKKYGTVKLDMKTGKISSKFHTRFGNIVEGVLKSRKQK